MQQGERVMREAGSPLLKGKKRGEPKLAARGSGDKQGEKHPRLRSTLLAPLSPCCIYFLGGAPGEIHCLVGGEGAEGVRGLPCPPLAPGAPAGSRAGLGRRDWGWRGMRGSAPNRASPSGPVGGQQGAPEDRRCPGWASLLPAPGAARAEREPRPGPGAAAPAGDGGDGEQPGAGVPRQRREGGRRRHPPLTPSATPGRPPPMGPRVWTPPPP